MLEFVEGMQFDKGYISPYFAVNTPDLKWEQENVLVLLLREEALERPRDAAAAREGRAGPQAAAHHRRGRRERSARDAGRQPAPKGFLEVCAVKAPGFGDRRKAMMEDIAVLTGGTFISEDLGIKLENVTLDMLGTADQVSVDKENTTIIVEPDEEREKAIKARVQTIRTQMDQTESEYDKEKFSERLAKLVGGVAIIKVGAATEAEMKQTKGRVEDALHATRAAVAEGIVPGGGAALLRCDPGRRGAGREAQGRRADRGRDRGPRAVEADPHHRRELRQGRRGHRRRGLDPRREEREHRLRREHRRVRRHVQGRIIDPLRVTRSALDQRRQHRRPDAHDRGDGHQDRRGRQEVPVTGSIA